MDIVYDKLHPDSAVDDCFHHSHIHRDGCLGKMFLFKEEMRVVSNDLRSYLGEEEVSVGEFGEVSGVSFYKSGISGAIVFFKFIDEVV